MGAAGNYLRAIPATCRRWSCSSCGRRNARRLAARIAAAEVVRFVTLTARAQPDRDPADILDELNAAWRDLWKRIQRQQGDRARGYVKIVELTKSGTPHLHIGLNAGYLSQRWLSAAWSELTGYTIVDVRRVETERGLARYLAKYLTKTHTAVGGRRKWSASSGFLPPVEVLSTAPDGTQVRWSFQFSGAGDLLETLRVAGWVVRDGWWRSPRAAATGPP